MKRVLYPRSIAVIGASRKPESVGAAVVRNLVDGGFPGAVYQVNPAARTIQSLAVYANVDAVPAPLDLAVIALPAAKVLDAANQCGRYGVRAMIVLSAGFGEDVLLRRSALAEDHPTVAEVDCNPVILTASGAVVVDARIRVEEGAPRRPLGARN